MAEAKPTPRTPYRDGVAAYANAGWHGVIPIKRKDKTPSESGVTGEKGEQRTPEEAVRMSFQYRAANIALRLDPDLVGIDVDDYDGRNGAATLANLEAKWGTLPATVYSTSRGAGPSGIRLYRLRNEGKCETKFEPGIEIVQWHHRFVMCWPSVHPMSRETYEWYAADGSPLDGVPVKDDIPFLPERWEAGLRKKPRKAAPTGPVDTLEEPPAGLLAAIAAVAHEIASLPPGSAANDPCNTAALKLSAYIPHAVSADYVRAQLQAAVDKWEDGHDEGYEAIESGLSVVGTDRHQPRNWTDTDGAGFTLVKTSKRRTPCPDPGDPKEVARHIADEFMQDGYPTLLFRGSSQFQYNGRNWEDVDQREIEARLWNRMDKEMMLKIDESGKKLVRWAPAPAKIGALYGAIMSNNFVREDEVQPGDWRGGYDPQAIYIPVANGIVRVKDGVRELISSTPRLFNLTASPVKYNPVAKCRAWHEFLNSIFPDDQDSIRLLQQYMGYLISGRSDLEKILALIGPTRSGKGTIADAIAVILGEPATAALRLSDLSKDFGMEKLIGKSVAIIPDNKARAIRADKMQSVIENLLSISANDRVAVNRKNRKELSLKLGTRIVLLSNDIQQFSDGSNAITERFIIVKMAISFLNREDPTLKRRIAQESAGIFNWALDGLDDLHESKKLLQPKSGLEYKDLMQSETPEAEFVRRRLEIGSQQKTTLDELWVYWKPWCDDHGIKPGNKNHLPGKLGTIVTTMGGSMVKRQLTAKEDPERPTVWEGIGIRPTESGLKLKSANGDKL